MSELTMILDQILDFVGSKNSEIPNLFNRGISMAEVRKIAEVLPFRLKNEITELYMWRNGASNWTDVLGHSFFLPLSMAVISYEEMIPLDIIDQNNNDSYFWQVGWFPIFCMDSVYYFVSCRSDASAGKVGSISVRRWV